MRTSSAWRMRALVALAIALAVAGCAQVRSRLPQRTVRNKPPATAPARPPTTVPAPKTPFLVLAPGNLERDRNRVRRALADGDHDALAPGDVGYYLDVLQGRLRQLDVPTVRRGNRLVLDLSR